MNIIFIGKGKIEYIVKDTINKNELKNILKNLIHKFDGKVNITGTVIKKR